MRCNILLVHGLETTIAGMKLSIAIIAGDEERHIGECLASLGALGDEIVVLVDDRSRDRTAAIAENYGAKVAIEEWRGFPAQRNLALERCVGEWVLFIDADERLSAELRTEIAVTLENPTHAAYRMPRHNRFFGQVLRGGGWYPDRQLRLMRRDRARYDEQRLVHETVAIDGSIGDLAAPLEHINIERLDELYRKQSRYALVEARTLASQGRRTRARNLIGAPAREFVRRYWQLGGWRDGLLGLFLCVTLAWFELVAFVMLWALTNRRHS